MMNATIIPFPLTEDFHLSASAVSCFQECMREYYYKYVCGLPRETESESMALGSAIHQALSYYYLVLKQDHEKTDLAVLQEIAEAYLEGKELSEQIPEAHGLLQTFMTQGFHPDPKMIIAVEQRFDLPLIDPISGETVTMITGFWDLVVRNEDGSLTVLDHKVVKRNDKAKADEPNLQLAIYSWAARNIFGAETVNLQYQDIIKNKVPKVDIKTVNRTDPGREESEALKTMISVTALVDLLAGQDNIENLMIPRKSWRCSGCGYHQRCTGT